MNVSFQLLQVRNREHAFIDKKTDVHKESTVNRQNCSFRSEESLRLLRLIELFRLFRLFRHLRFILGLLSRFCLWSLRLLDISLNEFNKVKSRNLSEISTKLNFNSILQRVLLDEVISLLTTKNTRSNILLGIGEKNNKIVGRLTLIHYILRELSVITEKLSLGYAFSKGHITEINASSTKVSLKFAKSCGTSCNLTSLLSLSICNKNFSFHNFFVN